MKTYGKIQTFKNTDFFIDKKQHRPMARFKKLENPITKRQKLMLIDFANTLSLWSIIIYCVFSLIFGAYVLSFIKNNADVLFLTAQYDE